MTPVWVTYADAAQTYGIHESTIRRWARHKQVHVRKIRRGNKIIKVLVNAHSIDAHIDHLLKQRKERTLNKTP